MKNFIESNMSTMIKRDIFDQIFENVSRRKEEMDAGEVESIIDALKTDLKFCQANEDILKKNFAIDVPRHMHSGGNRN